MDTGIPRHPACGCEVAPRRYLHLALPERLMALPQSKINALCDQPTLADALVATLSRLNATSAYVGERLDRPFAAPSNLVVGYRLAEDPCWQAGHITDPAPAGEPREGRIALFEAAHVPISDWPNPTTTRKQRPWNQRRLRRGARLDMLTVALSHVEVAYTINECVRAPAEPNTWWHAIALPMWWDDRLAEGHSPESARMMLGLTMHPTAWARVTFDTPTGHPAVQSAGRVRMQAG